MSADKAVEFGTDQATGLAEPSAPSSPNTLEYTIRRGDTWWGLADRFYGDGARAEELLEANIGRPQNDGRQITRRGFIYPGWTVRIAGASRGVVEESDGQRSYTVALGDTLSGIASTVLGDEARWQELFELNRGQAGLDEQHVLEDPSLIWPGLVLQLPVDNPATGEEAGAEPSPPALPGPAAVPVATPPATLVPAVRAPVELPSITAIATPVATAAAPSSSPVVVEPAPATQPPETSAPVAAPISGALIEIGGIAAGLGVAVWLALKSRRRPPRTPGVPETDTELDEHAFSRAAPAAVLAARRDGGDDPHGIVLGELLAGELLHRAHEAGLREVQLVVVAAPHRLLTACSTVRGVLVTPGVKSTVRHGPLLGGGVALWRYGGGPPIIDSSWFQCAH